MEDTAYFLWTKNIGMSWKSYFQRSFPDEPLSTLIPIAARGLLPDNITVRQIHSSLLTWYPGLDEELVLGMVRNALASLDEFRLRPDCNTSQVYEFSPSGPVDYSSLYSYHWRRYYAEVDSRLKQMASEGVIVIDDDSSPEPEERRQSVDSGRAETGTPDGPFPSNGFQFLFEEIQFPVVDMREGNLMAVDSPRSSRSAWVVNEEVNHDGADVQEDDEESLPSEMSGYTGYSDESLTRHSAGSRAAVSLPDFDRCRRKRPFQDDCDTLNYLFGARWNKQHLGPDSDNSGGRDSLSPRPTGSSPREQAHEPMNST